MTIEIQWEFHILNRTEYLGYLVSKMTRKHNVAKHSFYDSNLDNVITQRESCTSVYNCVKCIIYSRRNNTVSEQPRGVTNKPCY